MAGFWMAVVFMTLILGALVGCLCFGLALMGARREGPEPKQDKMNADSTFDPEAVEGVVELAAHPLSSRSASGISVDAALCAEDDALNASTENSAPAVAQAQEGGGGGGEGERRRRGQGSAQ